MPMYIDVITAASETVTKILVQRGAYQEQQIEVNTAGGRTAGVVWRKDQVRLSLPTLPADAILTRAEADQIVGYIAHECCHVLHSTWIEWQFAVQAGPRVQRWVNALEDVRIEAKEIRAGHFPNLRNLFSQLVDKHHFDAMQSTAKRGLVIGSAIVDAPYCALVLGRMANKYTVPTAHALRANMAGEVVTLVNHALAGVKRCRNTYDVRMLALDLIRMEGALAQPQQPPQGDQGDQGEAGEDQDTQDSQGEAGEDQDTQDGLGEAGEAGEDQDGQGEASEAGEDQGGQGEAGEAGEDQGGQGEAGEAGEDQDGQGEAGEAGEAGKAGSPPPSGPPANGRGTPAADGAMDLGDLTDKVIARTPGTPDPEQMRREGAAALPTSRCQIEDHPVDQRYPEANRVATGTAISARLPNNAVLHGQISRLLVSDEVHRRTHHETSGRLDRRALVRMGTGAVDVFSRRDDTPGINTAVLVLIDGSGSMSHPVGAHRRDTIAQTAAWHIAMAAEDADAKICVAAFYTAAFNGADVYTVKPWDVSMRDRAVTLEHTVGATSTPLAPAIIGAARLFDQITQATRRIMIVLTDGQCDYGANAVRSACNVAAQLGVEVVGLGMDCAEVIDAFPPRYSLNVTHVEQLATTGLGVLCDMLEDAAGAGAD